MRDRCCRPLGAAAPPKSAVRWNRRRVGSCGTSRPVNALAAFSLAASLQLRSVQLGKKGVPQAVLHYRLGIRQLCRWSQHAFADWNVRGAFV
jgi:hypothetical protein